MLLYEEHKGPHTSPRLKPTAFIWPLRCLLSGPFCRKIALNTPLQLAANSTVACTFCTCARCNKQVALVLCIKDAGREVYARNCLYFRSKRNLTISDKNSCILNMQRGITKQTQINLSWTDIAASLVPVTLLQNMKTGNDRTECIEKQSSHSFPPLPHTVLIRYHTTNQRIQWLRRQTANPFRLRMLNHSRQHPRSSESFQCSWTHRTDLFPTSSESLQMLQMSNGWACVFLP